MKDKQRVETKDGEAEKRDRFAALRHAARQVKPQQRQARSKESVDACRKAAEKFAKGK